MSEITEKKTKAVKKLANIGGNALGKLTGVDKLIVNRAESLEKKDTVTNKTHLSDNAFQQQIPKLTKRLLNKRLQKPLKFLNRFIPTSVIYKTSDIAFLKLAQLAEKWSTIDLADGVKLYSNETTQQEKQDSTDRVANQNRAYAAMGGGITASTGTVGTLADLLWLLLITLRMIYQTAHIHGDKLTGIEGAKKAFDILSQANLDMLPEKQAVIISMHAAGQIVDDVDIQVLEGLIKSDSDVAFFKEAVSKIVEQINIDINLNWLLKFLPVATGITGAVYSVYIINEVSAVLANEYKLED